MPSNSSVRPAYLSKLAQYDSPTICNVIELFEVRPRNTGYLDHRIKCRFPELPPLVGFAATATYGADSSTGGPPLYEKIIEQVEGFGQLPGTAVLVIQDLDDSPVAATFGDIMCSTYQAFGASGLITSGAGRDLDAVQKIKFPVFTGSAICSHGYCHFKQTQVPVRVGGITIDPGTLIHGDRNGITTIPNDIAPDVADVCEEFVTAENVVLDYVRSASPTTSGYRQAFAESQQKVHNLSVRLRLRRTAK